jgi:hypothetical protein
MSGLEIKGLEAGNESSKYGESGGAGRKIVRDMLSTKIELNALANTTYEYGVLERLDIVSFEMSEKRTKIYFTQRADFVFTLPAGIKEKKLCDCGGFCSVEPKEGRKCRITIDNGYFEFIYEAEPSEEEVCSLLNEEEEETEEAEEETKAEDTQPPAEEKAETEIEIETEEEETEEEEEAEVNGAQATDIKKSGKNEDDGGDNKDDL